MGLEEESKENHRRFLAHLSQSEQTVWTVAQWLQSQGISVKVNAAPKADKREEWKNYADHGDIEISQRVEIKQLSAQFTGPDDWPFRSKFIVCAKHSWDRSVPKPYAYIVVSQDGVHAAIVMGHTHSEWTVEERTDTRYENVKQEFYFCPIEHIKWMKMA